MKAKLVCPVNIGYNEYQDRMCCEIDLPDDLQSAENVAKTLMGAIVKDDQMKRWGLAVRLLDGSNITIYEAVR